MLFDNLKREKVSKREGYLCFFLSRLSKFSCIGVITCLVQYTTRGEYLEHVGKQKQGEIVLVALSLCLVQYTTRGEYLEHVGEQKQGEIVLVALSIWLVRYTTSGEYLEHMGEQKQESRVHAGPQTDRGEDAQPHPPHQVLRYVLCRRQPGIFLTCKSEERREKIRRARKRFIRVPELRALKGHI
jgi:hypothetical protein